ncbi:hypothetical protein RJT34_29203 [Clitoria ternatea]|uniref:Uncharacterized protein n=1 Tax=Clitoria ternatea TaxID=43366 RepID=A0AAN9I9I8_CLITE
MLRYRAGLGLENKGNGPGPIVTPFFLLFIKNHHSNASLPLNLTTFHVFYVLCILRRGRVLHHNLILCKAEIFEKVYELKRMSNMCILVPV